MSEEEKQALEDFKQEMLIKREAYGENCVVLMHDYEILHLIEIIEKQQKEIERYKKQVDLEFVEENYIEKNKVISKDKIREKIKELKNDKNIVNSAYWDGEDDDYIQDFQIKVLQELLGDEDG